MSMTRLVVISLFTLCFGVLAVPLEVRACRAVPLTPTQLSKNAEVIVRVTAVSYAKPPEEKYRTTGMPDSTVEFRVLEVLKGESVPATLNINGYLNDKDDFNDRPAPYDFIRPGGRAGSCVANSYKEGAEFLLFLKKKEERLTPYWAALTPTNEQLKSSDDPWLKWAKDYLQSKKGEGGEATGVPKLFMLSIFRWLRFPAVGAI